MATRSSDVMGDKLLNDPQLIDKIKNDPTIEIPKLVAEAKREAPAFIGDTLVYRIVVLSLGGAVILVLLGAIGLSFYNVTPIPDILTAIGSAAVGALAGLLAPSPAKT